MEEFSQDLFNKVKKIEIAAKQKALSQLSGMYLSRFKGRGIEISEVREFQEGDDPRALSASKSAQFAKPYVKLFSEERDLTVMIVVDLSASCDFTSAFETKRERIAQVAALISFSAIYNHDRVGLLLFSDIKEKYVPPKRGAQHGARIIRELLGFRPKDKGTNIANALKSLNHVMHKHGIIFLISDFIADHYQNEFLTTAKKDDLVCVRIFDPKEEALIPMGLISLQDLETLKPLVIDLDNTACEKYRAKRKSALGAYNDLVKRSKSDNIEISTTSNFIDQIRNYFILRKKLHPL